MNVQNNNGNSQISSKGISPKILALREKFRENTGIDLNEVNSSKKVELFNFTSNELFSNGKRSDQVNPKILQARQKFQSIMSLK